MAHQNYIFLPLPSLLCAFLSLFLCSFLLPSHFVFCFWWFFVFCFCFCFFLALSPKHCLISASSGHKLAHQNGLFKISDERADLSRARLGSVKLHRHSQPNTFDSTPATFGPSRWLLCCIKNTGDQGSTLQNRP